MAGGGYNNNMMMSSPHHPRKRTTGGGSFGTVALLLIWTAIMGGGGYVWFTFVKLPALKHEFHQTEVEPVKQHWKQKVANLEETLQDIERQNDRLAGETKGGKDIQIELDDVVGKWKNEKERAKYWELRSHDLEREKNVLTESNDELKRSIQAMSRQALIDRYDSQWQSRRTIFSWISND